VEVSAYLERIGFSGPADNSLETLRRLHLAHLYTVPFENLDIHRSCPIVLDKAALFDKIVTRRRGGFCYELNGLFCALLRELGFRVTMLSARVARQEGDFSPDFDHLCLRVDLHGPWLVDIGFGDGFRLPLRLNCAAVQPEEDHEYFIAVDGDSRVLNRSDGIGDWKPQYQFSLTPHALEDFSERCRFHQTSADSHFTRERICSLATPAGRITLSGMRLIVSTGPERTERLLNGPREYAATLREEFGMLE
jgi:N-hydroxyarylamine O-acetyltransferase